MKRSVLIKLADAKTTELEEKLKDFVALVKLKYQCIYILEQNILKFFAKVIISRNSDKKNNEILMENFKISRNFSRETFTPYDFLIALRIFMRKIKRVRKVGEEFRKDIQKKYNFLETLAKELEQFSRDRKRDRVLNRLNSCVLTSKGALTISSPSDLDLQTIIQQLFNNGWYLEKDALIQLVTLKDDFKNNDVLLESIPDRINFSELYRLIVIERIESVNDCYLYDALKIVESNPS